MNKPILLASMLASAALVGCYSDKPHDYGRQRPPVDQLDSRDRGLQSKDVVNASDQMTMDLLQVPELNVSEHRWAVVFTGVRNETVSAKQNLDIFVARMKSNIAQQGRGRIQIIANKDAFHDVQDRELEASSERDDFQQGGRPAGGASPVVQPDYALEAVARDLPNSGTDYYFIEFHLVDLRTREEVWNKGYEVRVAN